MRTENAAPVRLEDYRPSDYLIDAVHLDVRLHPTETMVVATLSIRPNPAGRAGEPLVLDGDELALIWAERDGERMAPDSFKADPQAFTLREPPARPFGLRIATRLDPTANTKLMGLYRSGSAYCTQCEAEGFRRITYFLDRPDVLSVYTTRIEADAAEAPVLLGNGNPTDSGKLDGGRHYAVWHDPHPKPAYLFALVGGDLDRIEEDYVTADGRGVKLGIYVEKGKAPRAAWAMDALIRSMRWDEKVFGRNYDLDVFNVVAVSDFNMGAMENKGLNIFNDKYVLADHETATDTDSANIEAIIAHEYFHNWTGNRITCRDWFQLCLKEGLTVFRDQEFTADERSRAVARIGDVRNLRAQQFAEDSGPLAHPVRPRTYREINNFYTATVYEKGAELVRMIKALIGPEAFRRGMDLYFGRCDGTAATVEDFIACFGEAGGLDVAHFQRWYEQAGTPVLTAKGHYDPDRREYRLDLAQATPPTPGQERKEAVLVPVALGLVGGNGAALDATSRCGRVKGGLFTLATASDSLVFENVASRPVPSLLRGFSAPVRLELDLPDDDLLVLFAHDPDPFNRWQAGQTFATRLLARSVAAIRAGGAPVVDSRFAAAFADFLAREGLADPAYAAEVATLPTENDMAREIGRDVDPDAIHAAREALRRDVGARALPVLEDLRATLHVQGAYSPDARSAGRRALADAALDLVAAGDPARGEAAAFAAFGAADNLTDRLCALAVLAKLPGATRETALAAFETRYAGEPLVLDKWFKVQAEIAEPDTLARLRRLIAHPAFSMKNPNRVRSLIGAFAANNPTQFNRPDGRGYALVADAVLELDRFNPQVAARLLTAFRTWRALEPGRKGLAKAALERIAGADSLSRDTADIVTRSLA